MPAHPWVRHCTLVAVAMMVWPPRFADAGPPNPVVVILPPARPPSSQARTFPAQPALQWAPPPAMGLTPGTRSPAPRCYAGPTICPLARLRGFAGFSVRHPLPINELAGKVCTTAGGE
jgi:hypothetical protein